MTDDDFTPIHTVDQARLVAEAFDTEPRVKVLVAARLCSSWPEAQSRLRKCRTVPGFLGGDVIRVGRRFYAQAVYESEGEEPLDSGWSRTSVTKTWLEKRQVKPIGERE